MRLVPALVALLGCVPQAMGDTLSDGDWPSVTIPRVDVLPTIDGALSAGEWDAAVPIAGLALFGQNTLAPGQPLVRMAWHVEGLLVAADVPLPPGQRAKAQATDWDGTVWQDDSLGIHIDHTHRHAQQYQFVVNALGTQLDSRDGDLSHDAQWLAAATNEPGRWTAEAMIPWQAVEGSQPAAGSVDGMNIALNASSLGGILTLSPVAHNLHEPARFAHFRYGGAAAAGLARMAPGDLEATQLEVLGDGTVQVDVAVSRVEDDGETTDLHADTLALTRPGPHPVPIAIPMEQGLPVAGSYCVNLRATGADGPLLV